MSQGTGSPVGGVRRRPDDESTLRLLGEGELRIAGRLVEATNTTLYCQVTMGEETAACVYKPISGERPLWDFPDGTLAGREVAAFEVSQAMGWSIVPPTVHRDGPLGAGMCQLWVEPDEGVDLVELIRSSHPALRRMSIFDAVVNNADRKGGHLLPLPDGHIYGVDHGVCFSVEDKLRTVLWQWRGRPLASDALDVLRGLERDLGSGPLARRLRQLLSRSELEATRRRIRRLLEAGRHPYPSRDWPAIPWPPI